MSTEAQTLGREAPPRLSGPEREILLAVAARSIRSGLDSGAPLRPDPADYPQALRERRASFVTLTRDGRLPFVFEASGSETHFTNGYDPQPRARRIFAFPQPGAMARIVRGAEADPKRPTWRAKVRHLPPLNVAPLRPAQITAIEGVERSLAEQRFDQLGTVRSH